ncbi:MAG TPA: hypothetical protein VFY92_03150 [Hyphomicrobiaceae bacterium]|nr:hypothetical protein [Hyphomicrobiaceae bacterium]
MTTGAATPNDAAIAVHRYAVGRLYGTVAGPYQTVANLRRWPEDGVVFEAHGSETGDDIARVLLA